MTDPQDSPLPDGQPPSSPFAEAAGDYHQQTPRPAEANPYETPVNAQGQPDPVVAANDAGKPALPHPNIGWGILWTLFLMVTQIGTGIVTLILIAVALVATGVSPQVLQQKLPEWEPVMLPIGTLTIVLAAIGIAVIVFRRDTVRLLGLRSFTPLQMLVTVRLVLPHAIVAGEIGNLAMEFLPSWGLESFQTFSQENMLLVLVTAALFPGIGEEIFFRGFLSRGLIGNHGVIAGAILSSLLFALIHMLPVQVCVTFVAGLTLQYVFLTTRSLWTSIAFHSVNNALAFLMMRYGVLLPIQGVTVAAEGTVAHTPVPLLLVSLACCGVLLAVLYYGRTVWVTPEGAPWNPGYFSTAAPPASTGVKAHVGSPPWPLLLAAELMFLGFIATLAYSVG